MFAEACSQNVTNPAPQGACADETSGPGGRLVEAHSGPVPQDELEGSSKVMGSGSSSGDTRLRGPASPRPVGGAGAQVGGGRLRRRDRSCPWRVGPAAKETGDPFLRGVVGLTVVVNCGSGRPDQPNKGAIDAPPAIIWSNVVECLPRCRRSPGLSAETATGFSGPVAAGGHRG